MAIETMEEREARSKPRKKVKAKESKPAPEIVESGAVMRREPPTEAKLRIKLTVELWSEILERLADGESLRSITKDDHMPAGRSIWRWMADDESLSQQYARAKEAGTNAMAEDILAIADDSSNDWIEDDYMKGRTPGYKVNAEAVARSKLRVDSRIWLMSKLQPKKYGDKLDLTTDGDKLPTPILNAILPNDAKKPEVVEGEIVQDVTDLIGD